VGLVNLGSESETCVGSRVHLVGVSISFEKNFYQLPFTPPLSGSPYRSFINEINALGVKDITDLNINRKILQSLRKPDYDLVKAIIYEKKLEELKPSHI
jgi:hypothetical protein